MALTQLDTAGGTIIDVAEPDGEDSIIELLPRFGGEFLNVAEIEVLKSEFSGLLIRGELKDGTLVEVEFNCCPTAHPYGSTDPIVGWVSCQPESLILNESIELARAGDPYLMIPDGPISTEGYWAVLQQPESIVFGNRNEAIDEAWPEAGVARGPQRW